MKSMMKIRVSALLLGFILILTAMCPAFAEDSAPASSIKNGDIICFGTPDEASGFDGKWLVLDSAHTNMGTDGMFLVSLSLIGNDQGGPLLFRDIGDISVSFTNRGESYAMEHPGVTRYVDSEIRQWCEYFCNQRLSNAEQAALIPTEKSDEAIVIPGFGVPLPGATGGTVDFDPAEQILAGDKIFLLSVEEVTNSEYGFPDNRSRVAFYKGTAAGYWLRSPHIPTFPLDVGFVFPFGAVMDYPVNGNSMFRMSPYARLACNLDGSHIASVESLATQEKVTIWRVTMQGDETNQQEYDTTIPVVGDVLDLAKIVKIVFYAVIVILIAVVALIVWLIMRKVKRNKARAMEKRS